MLKQQTRILAQISLATLSLAGCLGYRTPMLDPNAHKPASPQEKTDAAADLAREDGHPDTTRPDAASPETARPDAARPDAASPDAARSDAASPDKARADAASPDTARPEAGPPDAARPDLGSDLPPNDVKLTSACPEEKRYVLLLGDDGKLFRFEPDTRALTNLATVACVGSLNSMTVSPIGPAYISSQGGDLCSVDMKTFKVASTAFSPLLVGRKSYGMALLPDDSASGQTLYIAVKEGANSDPDHLERIDLSTFALTSIGYVSPTVPSAELTAGPDGTLYGFSVGNTESLLLNIDPTTASAIDVTKVPAGFSSNFAFALVYWQDAFYLFLGSSSSGSGGSAVYRYAKGDAQVTPVGTVKAIVIGAGVACASD